MTVQVSNIFGESDIFFGGAAHEKKLSDVEILNGRCFGKGKRMVRK